MSLFKVLAPWALLFATVAAAEPFSGVYVHPAEFANPALSVEEREALMDKTLDAICACGFTSVIPYANTSSGQVYWPGTDLSMAGAEDWDTLGIFARKARERGLKVMPALCILVSGHDAPAGILETHPDWALRNGKGNPLGWISPASAAAREWVVALALNLANHLKPDGILLDYLRFPNQKEVLLDPAGAPLFEDAAPAGEEEEDRRVRLQRFKESSLTALMTQVSQALRSHDSGLRIGLYSWGPHVPFDHPVAQCWPEWIRAGYLDLLNISGYCYRDNYGDAYLEEFEKRLRDAGDLARKAGSNIELSFALGVKTSHGVIPSDEEIATYLAIARRLGYDGVAAFAWGGLEPYAEAAARKGYFRLSEPLPFEKTGMFRRRLNVDFGADQGQNFGSLFKITDPSGRALAGAGFQGAYNTYYRGDRFLLHLFARQAEDADTIQQEPFLRPTESCHHYLFDTAGALFASDRKGQDATKRWNREKNEWEDSGPPILQIGSKQFTLHPNLIVQDGKDVFTFDRAVGTASLYYYASGNLFFHVALADRSNRQTFLHACPWDPEMQPEVATDLATASLALGAPGEFPYAYGQLHGDVFVSTNNGGLYRFRDRKWDILRASDPKVSYQVYTMLNYHDRLLMGQYPTGELFEIMGDELRHLQGWPPRPTGASPRAREAQSLALYRGELFAGVWPWGEVWRLPDPDADWLYAGRLFTHPEIQPEVTAPYEAEMTALGEKVNNLWGQRVTSLVPFEESLFASTANKNGAPHEERLQFLSDNRHLEYGAVHRFTLPGHRSVAFAWTGQPVTFDVAVTPVEVQIYADGRLLAILPLPQNVASGKTPCRIHWGQGVFGPLYGKISSNCTLSP